MWVDPYPITRTARIEILLNRMRERILDLRDQLRFECACYREIRGDEC